MIVPKSEVDTLIAAIENGSISKLKEINAVFREMYENYYAYEWTWALRKIEAYYQIDRNTITADDIRHIVRKWTESVVSLDEMIYDDARKEFSLSSKTGFGSDGNTQQQEMDFEQVRGAFDSNPFVTATLQHIKDKKALGEELLNRIKDL